MSSTGSSSPSSATDGVYTGPEYREAALEPLDPLLHADPYRPPLAYRLVFGLIRLLVRMLFRFEVEGRENIPTAPFLIASNHQAWYDTAFIVAAFPKLPMIYTMARRDTVFNRRWKRWLMPRLGVFPIQPRQGELDRRGVANVYQVLRRGGVVLIFPEGGYSRGRDLRPLRKGVAHFALQAGAPICPVAVSGVDRLRPFSRVEVSIAPPVRPDPPRWWTLNRRVLEVVDSVRQAIIGAFEDGEPSRRPGFLRRLPRLLPRLRPRRRLARSEAGSPGPPSASPPVTAAVSAEVPPAE